MFSWSGASGDHFRGRGGRGAVVRMITVMEVRKTSSVIVDPVRYEEPRCRIIPARRIFPARLTSVTKLLTVDLFLPSVRRESVNSFSSRLRGRWGT